MRRSSNRTIFPWLFGVCVVAVSALVETSVASRLEVGVCVEDVDTCISASHVGLRPDGLWIKSVHVYRDAHELMLDSLRIHVDGTRGLWLEGSGMRGMLVVVDDTPSAVVEYHAEKAAREGSDATVVPERAPSDHEMRALARVLAPARRIADRVGLPVFASLDGELSIKLGRHASMIVQRVDAKINPRGEMLTRLEGTASLAEDTVARTSSLVVTSNAEDGTMMKGEVLVTNVPLRVHARARGEELRVVLADEHDGRFELHIPTMREPQHFSIESEDFSVPAGLGPFAQRIDPRLRLDFKSTKIHGAVDISLGKDDATLTLKGLGVDGLIVRSGALAREPVTVGPWRASGVLERHQGANEITLALTHRDLRLQLQGSWNEEEVDIEVILEDTECGGLLDAIPHAMSNVVASAKLEGRVGGRARLHFDRASLIRVREVEERTGIPQGDPGLLEFDLPLERKCKVTSLPPEVDIAALARPYVHRFHDGDRALRRKVFDTSDDDFVALTRVRSLGQAFIALEDLSFQRHDGFDREQIRRAVWHNLTERRFSRGASTISQQTARNLWLGIDRSLGRKLQEALLTKELESHLTKDRILEIYINIIELGPGVYGVKEAAEFYFGRAPEQLNLIERIHLASLAPAPSAYSRKWRSGAVDDAWMQTLRRHIQRMRRKGYISRAQAAKASQAPLRLLDRGQARADASSTAAQSSQ